jgi:hypothetical protein
MKKRLNGSLGLVNAKAAMEVTIRFSAVPTAVIKTEFKILRIKSGFA